MKQVVTSRGGLAVVEGSARHRLRRAEAHHMKLEARIDELGRRPHLTPNEAREMTELKKQKLRAKDELTSLRLIA